MSCFAGRAEVAGGVAWAEVVGPVFGVVEVPFARDGLLASRT